MNVNLNEQAEGFIAEALDRKTVEGEDIQWTLISAPQPVAPGQPPSFQWVLYAAMKSAILGQYVSIIATMPLIVGAESNPYDEAVQDVVDHLRQERSKSVQAPRPSLLKP